MDTASDAYYAIGCLLMGLALLMLFITAIASIPKKLRIIHWRWVSLKGLVVQILILLLGGAIIGTGYALALHRKSVERRHAIADLRAIADMPLADPSSGPQVIYKYDASRNDYDRILRNTAIPYLFLEGAMLQPYTLPDEEGRIYAAGRKMVMDRQLRPEITTGMCVSLNPTLPVTFYPNDIGEIVVEYTLDDSKKRSILCHKLDELAGPFSQILLIVDAINRVGSLAGDTAGVAACQKRILTELPVKGDATDLKRWKSLAKKSQAIYADYLQSNKLSK